MSRFRSPVVAAIASAALTATVVGGVAIAQTSTSVVTACVAEKSGNVRIVSTAGDCKPNEVGTTWNEKGEKGDQGLPGENGEQGVQGPPGVSGLERIAEGHTLAAHGSIQMRLACPTGKSAIGGGAFSSGGTLETSTPDGFPPTGWLVQIRNDNNSEINVSGSVLCALTT